MKKVKSTIILFFLSNIIYSQSQIEEVEFWNFFSTQIQSDKAFGHIRYDTLQEKLYEYCEGLELGVLIKPAEIQEIKVKVDSTKLKQYSGDPFGDNAIPFEFDTIYKKDTSTDPKIIFYITANEDTSLYKNVLKLVSYSPKIENIKIIAFRPPQNIFEEIEIFNDSVYYKKNISNRFEIHILNYFDTSDFRFSADNIKIKLRELLSTALGEISYSKVKRKLDFKFSPRQSSAGLKKLEEIIKEDF